METCILRSREALFGNELRIDCLSDNNPFGEVLGKRKLAIDCLSSY
jgi:hypothetical protein